MICATCFSCTPMPVVGKAVANAGRLLTAALSTALNWLARVAIWLADCTRDMPVSKVSNCCAACARALQIDVPSEQLMPARLPGWIDTGFVAVPLQKIGAPATETTAGYCAPAFSGCSTSATLPAHPVALFESGPAVCI